MVEMMLAATGGEDDVRAALADYAESSGFIAIPSPDRSAISIVPPKQDMSAEGEDGQVYGS